MDIALMTMPVNLFINSTNGELWIAAHNVAHQFFSYVHNMSTSYSFVWESASSFLLEAI
jgi:hypothetical protein